MKDFVEFAQGVSQASIRERLEAVTVDQVRRAIASPRRDDADVLALFSPAADELIEEIAQAAAALTERRFGRVISLYTPIYLSNECVNHCKYCGFNHDNPIPRMTLSLEEAEKEAKILHDMGFRHILLVSGESRRHVGVEYLEELSARLHREFDSISIEVNPMNAEEYGRLNKAGVDGLALYQETYDPDLYQELHPAGPKRDYINRLRSVEYGGQAGFRSLGIGALLGLKNWREEAVMLAWHGRYLTRCFWRSRVAVSFPRIRDAAGHFAPPAPVSDRDMTHMICATRLLLPDSELVMSTREPADFRDRLIGLGITRVSAGSRTHPGGYSHETEESGEQFEVVDARTPEQVAQAIAERGHEPVWKDFDRRFITAQTSGAPSGPSPS